MLWHDVEVLSSLAGHIFIASYQSSIKSYAPALLRSADAYP